MGIRIQSPEIDVPKNDSFENDLLGRKESVEVLTQLIGSIEGPCVLAVDAAWGTGKTTFLRIWEQHLRNQGFPVVKFNAWETDFSGDSFVALSTELTEGLHEYADAPLAKEKIDDTKKVAKEVMRLAFTGAIRHASGGILDVDSLTKNYAENGLSQHQEAQKSIKKFRETLQNMAKELSKQKGPPLIVMIDELDRCRPSYAVELLEVAKHLFSVDHIVFVLAVNRSELAHSIKALYGADFDAQGYLRRFFDLDFRLPYPERERFIKAMLGAIQIDQYFQRTIDENARFDKEDEVVRDWLLCFFRSPDLSLRRIAQAIHRLGLVFASLRSDQRSFAITAVVALIVRTIDSDLYHQFVRNEATDLQVVDKVFGCDGIKTLQREHEGCMFEVMIILAACEASGSSWQSSDSPLLKRYAKLVEAKNKTPAPPEQDINHAEAVIGQFQRLRNLGHGSPARRFGFRQTVQRLELLSSSLIDERSRETSHDS